MKNIYSIISDFEEGTRFAIATVIETKGSTPRKAGSSALFSDSGLVAGTVGGGVLEGRIQKIALESIGSGSTGVFHFDLDYDISFKQNAICGGDASILVEVFTKAKPSVFEQIKHSILHKKPGILITVIKGEETGQVKTNKFWINFSQDNDLPVVYSEFLKKDIEKTLSSSARDDFAVKVFSSGDQKEEVKILLESVFPKNRLIIAGAGHIGRALSHFGNILDFEVTVIDDRPEYANLKNIPDADHIIVDDIGVAIDNLEKESDTFLVIVTRGHNDDAKALRACINSNAAYIGMIGSRTKIEQIHQSFIENGWASEARWSAIHSPIGLEIRSETVEEIAVSIAAQLIMIRNRKS